MRVRAYGTHGADRQFGPLDITRREPGPEDVVVEVLYCGICHSDLHTARSEWSGTRWPCVPGHEIVGRVSAVGSAVTRFRPGDVVGVGVLVDSCGECDECRDGLENYCDSSVGTYNEPTPDDPGHTLGGYSQAIVVTERFVLRVSHPVEQLAAVAPLLCAGITTYSPLRRWGAGPGKRVGVVGIGGLGHMGVKLAHAMGAHVVAFTSSETKRDDAVALGADEVVLTSDASAFERLAAGLHLIVDTVSAPHDLDKYLALLKRDGTLVLVGLPGQPHAAPTVGKLIGKRRSVAGSMVGGLPETQAMLDFCAAHDIVADVEVVGADQIDEAYERMLRGDVRYRFVIDAASLA